MIGMCRRPAQGRNMRAHPLLPAPALRHPATCALPPCLSWIVVLACWSLIQQPTIDGENRTRRHHGNRRGAEVYKPLTEREP